MTYKRLNPRRIVAPLLALWYLGRTPVLLMIVAVCVVITFWTFVAGGDGSQDRESAPSATPATLLAPSAPVDQIAELDALAAYPTPGSEGIRRVGVVRSVYDGDTATITFLDREDADSVRISMESVRLAGVDAPEVRGSSKGQGIVSRDRARALMPVGSVVRVLDLGEEKYGRTLGVVTTATGVDVANALVDEGFAREVSYGN